MPKEGDPPRKIKVCAGIGDNIWLIQKLMTSGEKFKWRIAGDIPKRGQQIFDLTPDIVADCQYDDDFSSLEPIKEGLQHTRMRWENIFEQEFYLSVNQHLERGRRLEGFLPDLMTTFSVRWQTEKWADEARELLPMGKKYVGLYGSAYCSTRNWGFWEAPNWKVLAGHVLEDNPDVTFIIIGASFDTDLGSDLSILLSKHPFEHKLLMGRPLGLIVEVMKRLDYFFSFPSGLGILSASVGCPTLMFYPPHLEPMVNAWADPALIKSSVYTGALFCTPKEAIEIARNGARLRERLR